MRRKLELSNSTPDLHLLNCSWQSISMHSNCLSAKGRVYWDRLKHTSASGSIAVSSGAASWSKVAIPPYFVTVHVKRQLCWFCRCHFCQLSFLSILSNRQAWLPCAACWGCWVADCSIELQMVRTQTVFLFYNMPVTISRLLVLSLQKYACTVY